MPTWIVWMYAVVGVVSAATSVATAYFDILATSEDPSAPRSYIRWYLLPVIALALGTMSHVYVALYQLYCLEGVTCCLKYLACMNAALSIALGVAAVAVSATDATDESSRCRKDASQRCEHLKLALSIALSFDALLLMIASIGLLRPARGLPAASHQDSLAHDPRSSNAKVTALPTRSIAGFKAGPAETLSILFFRIAVDLLVLDAFPNDHKNAQALDGYFLLYAIILFLVASILLAGQVVVLISEMRTTEMEPLARRPQLSTTAV
ncbi:hypothetical protein LEN26_016876 [Aphanomyces euteiches]|nr:hypothetical protein LEN26_016876 [Aphanomyces euteiches]KAH9113538.1 hypothetical protein AeMF1_012273 [Aphanomyces euteiches]KAH9186733.1 hypothetical protein AeNC1_011283 [Aphanomyces euteiches]